MRVKFLAKTSPDQDPALWTSLFPNGKPVIDGCEFVFDLDAKDYDWLVVYEGLPPLKNEKKINRVEPLSCARSNTILITTEPSSIRLDGPWFMRQFGYVLTNKASELVRKGNHIKQTPPLRWFYGRPMGVNNMSGSGIQPVNEYMTYDTLAERPPMPKTKDLSTVCSTKKMAHTVHAKRYEFVMALRERMPELSVYGRGINPIDEKSEAMDDYRYHLAIENHIESGHWTEKLSDSFLAYCLPFYFGDPDYAAAFPRNSVIPINIYNLGEAEAIIRRAIAENAYEKRLPDILKARELVLTEHNLMIRIARIINARANFPKASTQDFIYGRHIFRKKFPLKAASDALFRTKMRKHPKASPLQLK